MVIDGWVRCDRESGTETEWRGAGADPPAPYVDESAPNAAEKSFGADVAEDVDVEGVEGMRFEVELYGVDIFDTETEGDLCLALEEDNGVTHALRSRFYTARTSALCPSRRFPSHPVRSRCIRITHASQSTSFCASRSAAPCIRDHNTDVQLRGGM